MINVDWEVDFGRIFCGRRTFQIKKNHNYKSERKMDNITKIEKMNNLKFPMEKFENTT